MFDSHRMTAGFLAATLTVAALFVYASAASQEVHGIIVYGETDQANSVAYGFAWNFPAKDTAHAAAVNACISSGGRNCIELAWFQNGCGALAIDGHGNAQGKPGMTREQAEARALRTCEAAGGTGCNIVGSLCTTPDGDPGTYSGSESVLPVQGAQAAVTEPRDDSLTHDERVLVQQTLNALGFDAGPADGIFGQRTRAAVLDWQDASGHEATGRVTREQFSALTAVDASPDEEQEARQEAADNQSENILVFGPETGPKCADGESEDELCWYEFSNKSNCFFLGAFYPKLRSTHSWSGNCLGNVAHGRGTMHTSVVNSGSGEESGGESEGELVQGFIQGRWVSRGTRGPNIGTVWESQYVDSKRVGWVTMRRPDGRVWEYPTIDGKADWSRIREK